MEITIDFAISESDSHLMASKNMENRFICEVLSKSLGFVRSVYNQKMQFRELLRLTREKLNKSRIWYLRCSVLNIILLCDLVRFDNVI